MNSGATAERVYDALKQRILDNSLRPGERLDPARLGALLHSSATPVRDALHILTGERLVETRVSDGFHVPAIDAPALQDLYAWNAEILLLAVRNGRPALPVSPSPGGDGPAMASATAALFAAMASGSTNVEHHRAVASLNDRLQAARLAEGPLMPDGQAELAGLAGALNGGDLVQLRRLVARYHHRRIQRAADIVRALYRPR